MRTLHSEAGAHVASRSWCVRYTSKLYARCAESFALSVRHCRHPRSSGPSQCEKTRKTLKRRRTFSILRGNPLRSSRPSRRPRELTPNRTKRHIRSTRARKSLRIRQICFRGTHFSMLSPRAPLTRTVLLRGDVMFFFILPVQDYSRFILLEQQAKRPSFCNARGQNNAPSACHESIFGGWTAFLMQRNPEFATNADLSAAVREGRSRDENARERARCSRKTICSGHVRAGG